MKKVYVLIIALFLMNNVRSQVYVTIPDTNFAAYLHLILPQSMSGNQLDISSPNVTSQVFMEISSRSISDLTGIQYFTSLANLDCSNNNLSTIPPIANSIRNLRCNNNHLISLPNLPDSLIFIDCENNQLTWLPDLPNKLSKLSCGYNQLTSLPVLPEILRDLTCRENKLTSLPLLPLMLKSLYCENNYLTTMPALPDSMYVFYCGRNHLTSLPALPDSIHYFMCDSNQLISLPALPNSLLTLYCPYNQLTSLPALSGSIQQLDCGFNKLTTLPAFPNSLPGINCENNLLVSLPTFPAYFGYLNCSNNQLTSLPVLSDYLQIFNCSNNFITCIPTLPEFYWQELNLSGNPFTCLPNYVSIMNDTLLNYPLCQTGDIINNPNNCNSFEGISGFIYKDVDANCLKNSGDINIENVHLSLLDSNNNLIGQTYSLSNGVYIQSALHGKYKVKIDTLGMPFNITCANPGVDSNIILNNANPAAINVNFPVNCKPSIDIGVQSVVNNGLTFPGLWYYLFITAGDMSQWNNLDCSAGIGGQVQVTVTGPASYQGIAPGALTPSIASNVYTYNISDFGAIDNSTAFGLKFLTDTTAQSGDEICVNVLVIPTIGDNNPTNNNYDYCYTVSNSMDPNMKETYPVKALPGYNGYFTYTVHFQNTGTASAINVRILDTLNNNLDLSTFQVINYSHANSVSLNRNILTVRYANILLPDSATNPEASKGFVQYRIKPKSNLPVGTHITNTALIYFDYNAPVVTNTTVNIFDLTGIQDVIDPNLLVNIYPNPFTYNLTFQLPETLPDINLSLYDVYSRLVSTINASNTNKITLQNTNLPKGIYFYRLTSKSTVVKTGKVIKN